MYIIVHAVDATRQKPVEGHWMCFQLLNTTQSWGREAVARPDFQEKETPAVTIDSALIYDSLTSWREAPFFFNVLSLFFLFRERKLLLINATEAAGRCWKLTGRHRQKKKRKRFTDWESRELGTKVTLGRSWTPRTSSIMSNFKSRAFSFSLRIRKPAGVLVLTKAGSNRLNLP